MTGDFYYINFTAAATVEVIVCRIQDQSTFSCNVIPMHVRAKLYYFVFVSAKRISNMTGMFS